MGDHPAPITAAKHKELTEKEVEALAKKAFALERKIKKAYSRVHEAWWVLAEALYEFHEGGYWRALGYDSLDEFLAQPDLGMSRSQFFRMTKLHRDLVVVRKVSAPRLKQLEPSKVAEVAPAIVKGDVKLKDALDDVKELGFRDLRTKYNRKPDGTRPGLNKSKPLDTDDEPIKERCPTCGSWVDEDNLPKEARSSNNGDGSDDDVIDGDGEEKD